MKKIGPWRCPKCGTFNPDGTICKNKKCKRYRYSEDQEKLRIMTGFAINVNNNANETANKQNRK